MIVQELSSLGGVLSALVCLYVYIKTPHIIKGYFINKSGKLGVRL